MAGRIPDAFIDDIVARTDIVEVIGSRVPLKRAGREYHARCPFHDERTPSFTVSPTKQFYHCFGCGAHGTVIRFLMDYERMEFLDAVEDLAARAGMEVPRETRQVNQSGEVRDLYAALEAAQAFFRGQLAGNAGASAYLQRRGVDAATAERFGIGWAAESWDALKTALGTDERRLKLLDRAGLLSTSDSGRVYDKFRSRIMFPIHDRRGRVIAFGGRVLEKDDGPKYLNSPETALFHKGRELYGLWQVRQAHAKIARLIVVEGYMDVVSLFQFGVTEAVATLGTATTPDHAELLFRNAADVYFCFDGDRAGRAAAWKAVESVLPRMRDGRQAFYLFLPEGEDPDSIVRAEGAQGFDARLKSATPLSEFVFAELGHEVNLNTLDGRARLAERARPMLERIPDGAFRDLMFAQLHTLTGVGAAEAPARGQASPAPPARGPGLPGGQRRSVVRSAIQMLLQQPSLAEEAAPPYAFQDLDQPGVGLLVDMITLARQRPGITTGALLEHFAERPEGAALQKLAVADLPGEAAAWRSEFHDALASLARTRIAQRISQLQAVGPLDDTGKAELRELLVQRAQR